ncbi:SDR family oxidoreductase [Nocardia sp. alder85J]|uniref:SDR family oxidoreductase n=1 Tax=Nocardia sp. alder85J TaxID=2862949 RepID=UPI001CD39BE8|nr:SDR family oxidoreductase [Nocardia sp. alder85J]MCX4095648.1 SDR family oxidoreductase [Nocardia sp. alder85J]
MSSDHIERPTPADAFVPGLLAGRVAFVAGGSSGINLAIAQRFAEKGARVMLMSRSAEKLDEATRSITEAGGVADFAAGDVRDPAAVAAALAACRERFGTIDIVLSGAAGNFLAPASELSPNGFRTVIEIDLIGTFNVLRHAHEHLRTPGASIISITAPQAVKPMVEQVHAGAAKAGVNMLTKVLAAEWGQHGVRVNAISPGFIAGTEGTHRLIDTAAKKESLLATIPLGRLGQLREIADVALFLASDHSSYVTGSIFECDGGLLVG